jgi:hypothetical protein
LSPSRGKRLNGRRFERGFISLDMILLLVILAAFLVGVVGLTARGVSSFQPAKGSAEIREEADRLLDRLEAMVTGAKAVSWNMSRSGSFAFVADLDGSGGTVKVARSSAELSGLEVVLLERPSESSRKLVAVVRGDDSSTGDTVTLTTMLDPRSPHAFVAVPVLGEKPDTNTESSGASVGSVRFSVRLASSGESGTFTRLVRLSSPAFLVPEIHFK